MGPIRVSLKSSHACLLFANGILFKCQWRGWRLAQLVECLPTVQEPWLPSPELYRTILEQAPNPNSLFHAAFCFNPPNKKPINIT